MYRDNHYGPRFDDVQRAFPDATRFHWHENAYNQSEKFWMVAIPSSTIDGHGMNIWKHVTLDELK